MGCPMNPSRELLQTLQAFLTQLHRQRPVCNKLAIGFSGGMDSHVLLHAIHQTLLQLSELKENNHNLCELRALHINHGLSPHADEWQVHCEAVCLDLKIPFTAQHVSIQKRIGESLEEQARLARYQVFAEQMQSEECLLMAHHQDDQAETLMLRLMRGAGPRGLAAMPLSRPLGKGLLWRPLLEIPRTALQDYANIHQLRWIDDESNLDVRFDRNFVRHELFSEIAKRWPGYRQSWQRSSQLCAEADQLNQELAAIDYQSVATASEKQLDCTALCALSASRQRNVIKYWLNLLGFPDPGWQVLRRCSEELLSAAHDAQPELIWDGHELRRFQNRVYALRSMPPLERAYALTVSVEDLRVMERIDLPDNGALLFSHVSPEANPKLLRLPDTGNLLISYRQGGEQCRLDGRRNRALKKILHDAGVPPWLRDRLPLLWYENQIACIPGAGVSDGFAAPSGSAGVLVEWQPAVDSGHP